MLVTLYSKDAAGSLRVWEIASMEEGFLLRHGKIYGEIQEKFIKVEPKANRTMEEQIELQINSRLNKQYDKGYVSSIAEAKNNPKTNASGLLKPMLAQRIDKVKNIDYRNAMVQRKYNGHRCLITKKSGKIIAYSKNGKPITTIRHILSNLIIPENCTLDGELYIHDTHLQQISSYVKKQQPESFSLQFICYDIISADSFTDRLAELNRIPITRNWTIAGTFLYTQGTENKWRDYFVGEGYEGAMIRLDGYGYEAGKRSKCLIKVKPKYDAEFVVVDCKQSRDGWAILVCKIPWKSSAETFDVSAPGSIPEKHEVWRLREFYIGKTIRVEYYELTKGDVPFHPVAIMWRDKEAE